MSWFGFSRQKPDKGVKAIQRRECFRLAYPPQAAPQIVNIPAQVIDISVKSVRFIPELNAVLPVNTKDDNIFDMLIKFHSGQTIDVSGMFFRECIGADGRMFYSCTFNKEISAEVINREQAFLLKNFPDFCRGKFR